MIPSDLHPLTFAELRLANHHRCGGSFHPLEEWSLTDWATALSGEVGEACNLIKKGRRGEPIERAALVEELADAQIYLDLLCARLGVDLGHAVAYKFNRVSEKRRAAARLHPDTDNGVACPPGVTLDSYFDVAPGVHFEDVAPPPPNPIPQGHSCNRHSDCDAADVEARSQGATRGAVHCHDESCPECFGS